MDGHLRSSDDVQDSIASLPSELWETLFQARGRRDEDTDGFAIALAPRISSHRPPLICWALPAVNKSEKSICVSGRDALWLRLSTGVVPCVVHPVRVLPLSAVILRARDAKTFESASNDMQSLRQALAQDRLILRQGSSRYHKQVQFECLLCEPVIQGYVDPARTNVTVLGPSSSQSSIDDTYTQQQELEIDESFLERSFAELDPSGIVEDQSSIGINGAFTSTLSPWLTCATSPLRPSASTNFSTQTDTVVNAFTSISTLIRAGMVSGDWALVANDQIKEPRLARVWSDEDQAEDNLVHFHPIFLHNLHQKHHFERPDAETSFIKLQRVQPSFSFAKLPIAQKINLSRIGTALSTSKQYEALFLAALKRHLTEAPRILKIGDWIAVPVDTVQSRWSSDSNAVAEPGSTQSDALVYFRVEACSLSPTEASVSPIEAGRYGFVVTPDVTQVVQSGVEQAWLPVEPNSGISEYFGLSTGDQVASMSATLKDLRSCLSVVTNDQSKQLKLETAVLLDGAPKSGKARWVQNAAASVGMHVQVVDAFDLIGDSDTKTEGMLRARFSRAMDSAPCVLLVSHVEALARKSQAMETGQESRLVAALQDCLAEANENWQETGWPVVLVATTSQPEKLPSGLLSCFKNHLKLEAPGESSRRSILHHALQKYETSSDLDVDSLAINTAALLEGDLIALVDQARSLAINRACQACQASAEDICLAGVPLTDSDVQSALDAARSAYSESIGAPKIPNVTWDDVGGLADVKNDILDTVQLPLQQPELFASGLKKRSGILLYGPPGTGKTLLAKAVATSCALNFFSVKGPELLNMYIGESEANVRRIFQRARDAAPCVIFFDELDSVAPKRGNQGDAGGVMDRIVSQLLAEVDGMAQGDAASQVFVIGATNRPDLLDPALLRPGRFDRMLYLGVSQDHEAQLKILQALTRKFKLHQSTSLEDISEKCPFHFTGADFYALCSDAMLKAMTRTAAAIDTRIAELKKLPQWHGVNLTPQYYLAEVAEPHETEVLVGQRDFEQALQELSPSVSPAEMEHYAKVQQQFASSTITKKDNKGKGKA